VSLCVDHQAVISQKAVTVLANKTMFELLTGDYADAAFAVKELLRLERIPAAVCEALLPMLGRLDGIAPPDDAEEFQEQVAFVC
jgi:hypothetical protein